VDFRRIKLLSIAFSRLKYIFYLLRKGKFKMARNYLWVSIFTRDAGAALFDPIYRIWPSLAPYPEAIEIEVTTRCHLRCIICEQAYWHEKPRDMTFEEFKRIVDQFPRLKWIGMTGIGSSFLNKDYLRMLKYLKSRSIFIEFYDSFDLINEDVSRQLIEMGVDKIWLSCDASTKETYEKIRIGTKWEKVMKNVRDFVRIKREKHTPIPEFWFHYVVTSLNINEMTDFLDLVYSVVGKDTNYATLITFSAVLRFPQVQYLWVDIPKSLIRDIEKKARKLGLFVNWNQDITPTQQMCRCTKWTEPFILATGHVQPCCIINEANTREHQKKYSFGNVFTESFADIWEGKYREGVRKIHRGEMPEICRYCRAFRLPEQTGLNKK